MNEQWLGEGDLLSLEDEPVISGFAETEVGRATPLPLKRPASSSRVALEDRPGPPPIPAAARRSSPGWLARSALVFTAVFITVTIAMRLVSQERQRQLARSVLALVGHKGDRIASGGEETRRIAAGSPVQLARESETDRAARTAERLRRPPSDRVTVALESRPSGATVVGPNGVLGTTPLPWTVRAGTTQTLTFAKSGFTSATRQISADGKKSTLLIELRRDSTPSRRPGRGRR